ncbi:Coenzyme F420:L-glutamate ligase [Candidatus Tiddalikarchaeum anstoanum]|nr:Coenzyme F420:L-glutamate ligase [Candidatus Tiddalikarchaeum anstoanum]
MKFKNPVLKCIYTRRSVRNYIDKPVPKLVINELLNAAVMAPSAMNTQPWNFSIISDKMKIKWLNDRVMNMGRFSDRLVGAGLKLAKINSIFYNAPLLIIISGKSNYSYLKEDTNLAVENMFLAAKSLGLGSCWIGFGKPLNNDIEARKELGIPNDFEISAILIFGYPVKEIKEIPKRTPKIIKLIK